MTTTGRRAAWTPGARLDGRVDGVAPPDPGAPTVGVLALQGDVHEHLRTLARLRVLRRRVRRLPDLDGLDAIIVPGGESTTIGKLLVRTEMLDPLRERIADGLPVFGTCAGMILLSRELDQVEDQPLLGVLGVRTQRNAWGRQIDSFDTALEVAGVPGGPVDVSFIRAPRVTCVLDPDVEVLARVNDHPVVVAQGHVWAAAFHPELTGDDRLHAAFLAATIPGTA